MGTFERRDRAADIQSKNKWLGNPYQPDIESGNSPAKPDTILAVLAALNLELRIAPRLMALLHRLNPERIASLSPAYRTHAPHDPPERSRGGWIQSALKR